MAKHFAKPSCVLFETWPTRPKVSETEAACWGHKKPNDMGGDGWHKFWWCLFLGRTRMKMSQQKHGNPQRHQTLQKFVFFQGDFFPGFVMVGFGFPGFPNDFFSSWCCFPPISCDFPMGLGPRFAHGSGMGSTAIFKSIYSIHVEYLDRLRAVPGWVPGNRDATWFLPTYCFHDDIVKQICKTR